jgi:hypothetical protein
MNRIIDAFLIWWLKKGRYRWSRLRRRLCEAKYRSLKLPAANSLEEIELLLKQITWSMDGPLHLFDSISYPQVVWVKKKDDCDGFAILAAGLLGDWQPECQPVLITAMLRPMRFSHTVCGFREPDGRLRFFDNGNLRRKYLQEYIEIVSDIQGASRLVCWDVVDPNTLQTLEFHEV